MLDPDCGLCYKLNKSSVVESSCVPVDKDSTTKAAWGRYVTFPGFLVLCSTDVFLLLRILLLLRKVLLLGC